MTSVREEADIAACSSAVHAGMSQGMPGGPLTEPGFMD